MVSRKGSQLLTSVSPGPSTKLTQDRTQKAARSVTMRPERQARDTGWRGYWAEPADSGQPRKAPAGENGEGYLTATQATAGTTDLSRQEVESGTRYPTGKDLVGTRGWEAIRDWYRAADILEKSVCAQGDLSASSTDFSSPASGSPTEDSAIFRAQGSCSAVLRKT